MDPPRRVVVCGGGVIGACTAYFLSKRGAAVTLVEKSSITCAASGKATGFLALDWSDGGPVSSLARASFNLHRTLAEELNGSDLYAYRPVTTLSATLAETTSSDKCPNLPAWVDGPAKWQRTIGTTETTAQVHPKMFTETLVSKAVEEYGLKVVIGKLEKVEVAEGAATAVVLEDGGVIEADAVVLALGPWSEKFSLLGSILFKVCGTKVHSVVLEPRDGCGITPHVLCLSYYPVQGGKPIEPEVHPRSTDMVCNFCSRSVATSFVEQYYFILRKCPENLHKFYKEPSLLSWPGPDGVVKLVTTLDGINAKIMSSDIKDCSIEVKTTESQIVVDRGIIIVVNGCLLRNDNVKKNFSHTFFLAKQEKDFYILNDILQFFDLCETTTNTASKSNIGDDEPSPTQNSASLSPPLDILRCVSYEVPDQQ